jgi:hypothetical protein
MAVFWISALSFNSKYQKLILGLPNYPHATSSGSLQYILNDQHYRKDEFEYGAYNYHYPPDCKTYTFSSHVDIAIDQSF